MVPRTASTLPEMRIACRKLPVTWVSAARNRFPKLWPASPPSPGKRNWNSSAISGSTSARATRQFRMSPGGSTWSSSRRRPELPPSSVTVTTAVNAVTRPPR